jgi:hypothetical protein
VQLAGGSHAAPELVNATLSDAMTAVTIILAMSFGLIVPKMVIDRLSTNRSHARP